VVLWPTQKPASFVAYFTLTFLLVMLPLGVADAECNALPGDYLVKLNNVPRAAENLSRKLLRRTAPQKALSEKNRLHRVRLHGSSLAEARAFLGDDVAFVEPNCRNQISAIPNDAFYPDQWALNQNVPAVWDVTSGSDSIVVAVLDTAVDVEHEDLSANIWTNPFEIAGNGIDDDNNGAIDDVNTYSVITDSATLSTNHWHGTHVAGIVGAKGNNGLGVSGLAWNLQILPIETLDARGYGTIADSIEAMDYVADLVEQGANIRVVNMSFGRSSLCSLSEVTAIERLADLGVLVVAAAGNNGTNNDESPQAPANCGNSNLISVAAVDQSGQLSPFSNFGQQSVHLAAAGVHILSTFPANDYQYLSGTSMAAPFVTGSAALLLSHRPVLSAEEVRALLTSSATPLAQTGGRINLEAALEAAGIETSQYQIDTDGDGVSDVQEQVDGTDETDRGSYVEQLGEVMFGSWNGFLSPKINVLELVNEKPSLAIVEVVLRNEFGIESSGILVNIPARTQRDLIINDLVGFKTDAYGLVEVRVYSGTVSGRVAIYQGGTSGLNAAYALPLTVGLRGESAFSFNTFQPSLAVDETNFVVANWGTLANLESTTKTFSIDFYNASGQLKASESLSVSPRSQVDFDAGHGRFGKNQIGLVVVRPEDSTARYISFVTRLGLSTELSFGFPIRAHAGSKQELVAAVDAGGEAWLEVSNTSNTASNVSVALISGSGSLAAQSLIQLGPKEQKHIRLDTELPADSSGFVRVKSLGDASVLASTMHYFRADDGRIDSMYGIQAKEALRGKQRGSYNLFLNMDNLLTISNVRPEVQQVLLRVETAGGEMRTFPLYLSPMEHLKLRFAGENSEVILPLESYGFVEVLPVGSGAVKVRSEIRRVRMSGDSLDFVMPLSLQ